MDYNRSADLTGLDAAVYLRKSRMEEGLATEEVLSKHQKTLYDYAAAHGIHILKNTCNYTKYSIICCLRQYTH